MRRFEAEGASFSNEEEASRHAGEGGDDEPFGLGAAVGGACDGDEEAEGTDKQVRVSAPYGFSPKMCPSGVPSGVC